LLAVVSSSPQTLATPDRGLAALDERLCELRPGVVLVRAQPGDATAVVSFVTRRLRTLGAQALTLEEHGAMFRELGAKLRIASLPHDCAAFAQACAAQLSTGKFVLVAQAPRTLTWNEGAALELGLSARTLLVWVVSDATALEGETFHLDGPLNEDERVRWIASLAAAEPTLVDRPLGDLEAWWDTARRTVTDQPEVLLRSLSPAGQGCLALLGLLGRAWPSAGPHVDLSPLMTESAVLVERGWARVRPTWRAAAELAASQASPELRSQAALALAAQFPGDPWALQRAAEVLMGTAAHELADARHAEALAHAADASVRRELVERWQATVLASDAPTTELRLRAAERALQIGEAEEAARWVQGLGESTDGDARVLLLLGRAAMGTGDLVAAGVLFKRAEAGATTDAVRIEALTELAELDCQQGSVEQARVRALPGSEGTVEVGVRLRARNTLGKLLLTEARWDEADQHFAEDAVLAGTVGDRMGELRARLNRGIALLSKGLIDEAASLFTSVHQAGESLGSARAQAFALGNLAVIALRRRAFGDALKLLERSVTARQQLGDRLRLVQELSNLAELRLRLGLVDHADHSIRFARRVGGPSLTASRRAYLGVLAARVALARGNTMEARREIQQAIIDAGAAGEPELTSKAHRVAARIALDDGDMRRCNETLARAASFAATDNARAEIEVLRALCTRASGEASKELAASALAAAESVCDEELAREAHALLCVLATECGDLDAARAHQQRAMAIRDQVAADLDGDARLAFMSKPDVIALTRLTTLMVEASADAGTDADESPRTQRTPTVPPREREIIGDDPALRTLLGAIRKVARANSTVLIHGESGTGKELVAEALHAASDRANGPLVTVNCAALVENLLLSELFGHEKGAFTGAGARRRGRFELAEGGTLFLDEIGDISPRTQVALLRVLQEKTFERVGGTAPIRANVRVVCATHRDLKAMVERGEFREDLYYRLRGIMLEVPALRARAGDIGKLATHLLKRIADERSEPAKTLTPEAVEVLMRHRWPGNIRELENVLRAVSLFAEGSAISALDLTANAKDLRAVAAPPSMAPPSGRLSLVPPPSLTSVPSLVEVASEAGEDEDSSEPLPEDEANATSIAYAQVRQGAVSLADMKRQIERDCIARALTETKGNITKAATLLGMKRPRLSQLVKQYGLAVGAEVQ
jgi:transcriptional regulator with GAF, ATPase, and Fis domain